MFARFCHFFGCTDEHTLKMPLRRFWAMERQISRIKAEDDLREISFEIGKNDKDQMKRIIESLTLEIGDTYQIVRPKIVDPEPGAGEKLKSLMG